MLLSSSHFFVPFALLLSLHIASFTLCCFTLLFVLLSSLYCATLFSSLHCWVLLFALLYSPLHTTRLSFSYCSTFLFALLKFLFCVILLSSSCCLAFICVVQLSFMLLFSFLCYLVYLFALLSSSTILLFQVQGFSCPYFPLSITIVGVLLFVEKSCTTPMHSFL